MRLDLAIRNGTVVTAADMYAAEIGIAGGRIVEIAQKVAGAREEIDATGLLVLPGGIDAHCHVEEPPFAGLRLADDFHTATRAAACGGTTTIMSFVDKPPESRSLREAIEAYRARARDAALIDYAFHLLLRTASAQIVGQELPALAADGYRSLKLFMTYDGYMLGDREILEVMDAARRADAVVMVHAENGHCVHWLADRLEAEGRADIAAFHESAPPAVEREATHRAITLAELTGARVLLVHVSAAEAMEQIRWARARGLPVMGETCPQYLVEHGAGADEEFWEGAKHVCSPPPRGPANAERLWQGVTDGTFQLVSSDHCAYRLADRKERAGGAPHFRRLAPGLPGLETRLPLLFSEGVGSGRLSPMRFVALTATNPARIYGLYPRKGSIVIGGDADLALWDPERVAVVRHAELHDACDYTPYEGREVRGWPVMTLSRGERVWDRGWVSDAGGRGRLAPRGATPDRV